MFESKINRGRANGYVPLDSGSKVPLSYLPPIQSTIDTGSLATTSSLQTLIDVTGSFATTGSNQFYGDQSISGSIIVTGSIYADNLVGLISSSTQISDLGFVTGSYTTINSFNSLTQSFNSISQSFTTISSSVGSVDFNGLISGSSQLTSSYDIRYVLSGSIGATPAGTISGSSQLTSSFDTRYLNTGGDSVISSSAQITAFGFVSGSYETTGRGIISSSANLVTTSSFNSYTASISTASLVTSISNLNSATSSYLTSLSGAISSSSQLTSSFDTRYVASGSISAVPAGTISGSSQLTSSYDSRYSLSGSVLTSFSSSVDNRLDTLEASIITGSVNYVQTLGARVTGVTTIGVTLVSGNITTTGNPIQIMVTGDANPVNVTSWSRLQIYRDSTAIGNIVQVENSSNLNVPYCLNVIDTPSAGTYTYSMRTVSAFSGQFDFGESAGPTLTAVELKSNTNLPSTNNTFTGTNTFNGITTFGTNGGDEGGEIRFGIPATNTTLETRVTTDIFQNRLRIFEGSSNAKGVYIDLSKAPNGVGGEITWKASGIVNRGVDVTLGNLKARLAATGNVSLQLSTISGTYSVYGSGTYNQSGTIAGITLPSTLLTTTPTYIAAVYNFAIAGAVDVWNIVDVGSGIAWRITMIIGVSFLNNFISIERLH